MGLQTISERFARSTPQDAQSNAVILKDWHGQMFLTTDGSKIIRNHNLNSVTLHG